MQSLCRLLHLYCQPSPVGLPHHVVGLCQQVLVARLMSQQIVGLFVEDVFRDEPFAYLVVQGGDISEDGIYKDMLVALDAEGLAGPCKLLQVPFVEKAHEPFLAEQVAQHMLQPRAVAGIVAEQHLGHQSLEGIHPRKDKPAVAFALSLVVTAVGEHFVETGAGEQTAQVIERGVFPALEIIPDVGLLLFLFFFHRARAGGIEPPLSEWKPTFRPRKPVCCRYTMPVCLSIRRVERVTGIEPAPAHWRYAESRSEVLRAAITLHPHVFLLYYKDLLECLFHFRDKVLVGYL